MGMLSMYDYINLTYEYFLKLGIELSEDQIIDILVFFGKVE